MIMNIQDRKPRFPWYDPYTKAVYIDRIANDLVDALIAAGAQFYSYCGQDIVYLNRWVTDLFRTQEVLSALDCLLNVSQLPYARDVAVSLRHQVKPLCRPVPEGVLGTMGGVKEPKIKLTKYLSDPARQWIREAIESGRLS